MDETILGAAQTYIGVLATFIVLCLFASKTREGSNFIIYTILMVGEDFKKHLRTYTDEINKEIEESAPKQLEQSDLDNIPKDVATKLNTSSRNIMMITQNSFIMRLKYPANSILTLTFEIRRSFHISRS